MNKEKKKASGWRVLFVAITIVIGVLFGILISQRALVHSVGIGQLLLLMLCLLAATLLHTVVHEAGHLVFGLLSGYHFHSFRVGSFMLVNENGKLKCAKYHLAGTGGQCLMAPPDRVEGKFPVVLYNLGGSLLNAVTAALFFGVSLLFDEASILTTVMQFFAAVGCMMALINGIPMRMGMIDNDGYNAIAMTRNREAADGFWVQLKVVEKIASGVRLKDMPEEWFTVPSDEAMKNSMVAARGVLACNRLMDEERFAEAEALMAHFLEIESGMVELHRSLLWCDRLYIELMGENRRELVEKWYSKKQQAFMKSMSTFLSVIRTEYALALLFERDTSKAGTVRVRFETAAKAHPYSCEADSERELMNYAQNRYYDTACELPKTE